MWPSSEAKNARYRTVLGALFVVLMNLPTATVFAQRPPSQSDAITIQGTVRNSAGKVVAEASVVLEEKGRSTSVATKTNADGTFFFSIRGAGTYTVKANKSGLGKATADSLRLSAGEKNQLNLILDNSDTASSMSSGASPSSPPSPGGLELEDRPNFTVAGIRDWTAAGGHGSDTTLRTSEALTRETLALKSRSDETPSSGSMIGRDTAESETELRAALDRSPTSFEANHRLGEFYFLSGRYGDAIPILETASRINPADHDSSYDLVLAYKATGNLVQARQQVRNLLAKGDHAELLRLLGDLDEELGDPLEAVRDYERAARLDPSELNYFEWATELLLHRAIQPAVGVFEKGAGAHPKSVRMLAGWGAALYANGSYDDAAHRVCAASDLKPTDATLYFFLGKMDESAPNPLPCVEQKLARFVRDQPQNAMAAYYYAMILRKREENSGNLVGSQQIEALLKKAASLDPKLAEPHLQLGTLFFRRGNFEQAIVDYNKAIEINPQLGEAHYRLGQACERIGEVTKAKQEFQAFEQIAKTEAAAIERQRREVRQFLIVLKEQPGSSSIP